MEKVTKDLLENMIQTWSKFNPQKAVIAHFDENEFSPEHWALDVAFEEVVNPEFLSFFLPALQVGNCIWFVHAYNDKVIFHIQ